MSGDLVTLDRSNTDPLFDRPSSDMKNTFRRGAGSKSLLTAAAAFLTLAGCHPRTESPPEQALARVVVAEARTMTVPLTATANGTTRALKDVTIRARVKGFLKEQLFKEGSNVKKGDLLLVIDEQPFKVKLEAAQAKLAEARANLEKAKKSKAVEVAKAQLDLDQSNVTLAEIEARRERALLVRNATPKEEVERKDATLTKNRAQVESSRASLEQARADYDINIASATAGVAKAQAEVDDARIELEYCRMSAPIDGRIGELLVKVGNLVGGDSSTELANIQQLDPMGVEFRPSSRYLPTITELVAKGLFVEFVIQGDRKSGDRTHPHKGKVYFIDNKVDLSTSTVLLKAEVPNPDQALLPGEYVKSNALIGERKDALVIPERALIEGQEGTTVFVVDAQGVVDRVKVTPAETYRGLRVIDAGLRPGQKVIVEGTQLVRRGSKVEAEVEAAESSAVAENAGGFATEIGSTR
jgi:RND family efflux transporter MFP subunit